MELNQTERGVAMKLNLTEFGLAMGVNQQSVVLQWS
jgi:hypothetical protein